MTTAQVQKLDRQLEILEIMADNVGYPIEDDDNYKTLSEMIGDAYSDAEKRINYPFDVQLWIDTFKILKTEITEW